MSALAIWNTDIKAAPHGRYVVKQRKPGVDTRVFVPERVILSTKCGKAVLSHYLPEEKRWLMLAKGEQPVAWQAWPEPYPVSARGTNSAVESAGEIVAPPAISPAADPIPLSPAPQLSQTAAESPEADTLLPPGSQFESDSPKSRPGDAAASLTQQSSSPRQERPSAQERSSDRSGGQFGAEPKPAAHSLTGAAQ